MACWSEVLRHSPNVAKEWCDQHLALHKAVGGAAGGTASEASAFAYAQQLHGAAMLFKELDELDSALALYQTALALYGRHERREVAATLTCMGNVLRKQGKLWEATRHIERSKTILGRLLVQRRDTLAGAVGAEEEDALAKLRIVTLDGLGATLSQQGKLEAAAAQYEQVLELKRILFGSRHTEVATTLLNFGIALRKQHKYESSRLYIRQAIDILEDLLGREHQLVAIALFNDGFVSRAQRSVREASEALARSLQIFRTILPESHAYVRLTLAIKEEADLRRDGKDAAAREYIAGVLAQFSKEYGADREITAEVRWLVNLKSPSTRLPLSENRGGGAPGGAHTAVKPVVAMAAVVAVMASLAMVRSRSPSV